MRLIRRDGFLPRLAVVIRAGDTALGSLWAVFPSEDAIVDCEAVLTTAAKLAALHMLTVRRYADADQDSRNTALQTALHHPGHADHALPLPGSLLCLAESTSVTHHPDRRPDLLRASACSSSMPGPSATNRPSACRRISCTYFSRRPHPVR